MEISFIKIFSFLKICLSTDCVSDPIVEIQPRIRLKCVSVNYDLCNGPVENNPRTEWCPTINGRSFIVELMFIVNYRNFLSYYIPTQKIVTLKRYKKKQTPDERYDELLHTPKNILLPEDNCDTTIFKIDIRVPEKYDFDPYFSIDEEKDVISFHSSSKTLPKNFSDIKKINELLLKHLFENIDEFSSYGFEFSFTVTAEGSQGEVVTKTINSDLFGVRKNEDDFVSSTCVLDPNDFHMPPISHTINVEKYIKLTKFCRKKKNIPPKKTVKKSLCGVS